MPVVDNGELVRIISRANLVRAVMRAMANATPQEEVSDEQIRERSLTEIPGSPGARVPALASV